MRCAAACGTSAEVWPMIVAPMQAQFVCRSMGGNLHTHQEAQNTHIHRHASMPPCSVGGGPD